MAHRAVLWQVLFVKVDQKLFRLESKLLVHDLGAMTENTVSLLDPDALREGGSERVGHVANVDSHTIAGLLALTCSVISFPSEAWIK